jgi:hypothetical protein
VEVVDPSYSYRIRKVSGVYLITAKSESGKRELNTAALIPKALQPAGDFSSDRSGRFVNPFTAGERSKKGGGQDMIIGIDVHTSPALN